MISCLGHAVMQTVEDSIASDKKLAPRSKEGMSVADRKQLSSVWNDPQTAAESPSIDGDGERARRESASVKSSAAFKFWSNYITDCNKGDHESSSPHNVGPEAAGAGQPSRLEAQNSSCVAPRSATLDEMLDRHVDLACFQAHHSSSGVERGPGDPAETPRVSCSIEVKGGNFLRRYSLKPSFECRQPKSEQAAVVKTQTTSESLESSQNEGIETYPTTSVDSSIPGVDQLTPDPTVSYMSSYIPSSYSNQRSSSSPTSATTSNSSSFTKKRNLSAPSIETASAKTSVRCFGEKSPTFSHYTLLIARGSTDSDDVFAALSSSTKSGASVHDLKLPVSSLSATTFLSSPSATTVEAPPEPGNVGTSASIADVAGLKIPGSTKSASSTIISAMSSFSIDEACRSSSQKDTVGVQRPSSVKSSSSRSTAPPSFESKRPSIKSSQSFEDKTPPTVGSTKASVTRANKKASAVVAEDGSWIKKADVSEASHDHTELTAPETVFSSQTMEETVVGCRSKTMTGNQSTFSETAEPITAAEVPSVQAAARKADVTVYAADPFEWAYGIWRKKGLISSKPHQPVAVSALTHPPKNVNKPLCQDGVPMPNPMDKRASVPPDVSDSGVYHIMPREKKIMAGRDSENTKSVVQQDDDFAAILRRWKTKSDDNSCQVPPKVAGDGVQDHLLEDCDETQANENELHAVSERHDASESDDKASHTREVWSPFVPRPPSPLNKLRTPSPARRSPSPSRQAPSLQCLAAQSSIPSGTSNFVDRPPLPLSGSGTAKPSIDWSKEDHSSVEAKVNASRGAASLKSPRESSAPVKACSTYDSTLRSAEKKEPVDSVLTMASIRRASFLDTAKIRESIPTGTAATSNYKNRGVALPKSSRDYKAAVQTFLQAVENNDLHLLKSYSNKSDNDGGLEEQGVNKDSSLSLNQFESIGTSDCEKMHQNKSKHQSPIKISPNKLAKTGSPGFIPIAFANDGAANIDTGFDHRINDDESLPTKSKASPLISQVIDNNPKTPEDFRRRPLPHGPRPSMESNASKKRHSANRGSQHATASPVTIFRTPSQKTPTRERTKLSPGESLIGKTIEVRSSAKRQTKKLPLNESAGSGTWMRLLNLENPDDSDDYDGDEEVMDDYTGRAKESHPWRRDMVVRKVNSFDSEFSAPSSLDACQCASSIFSGKDELVEFYLPLMGMACSCGARRDGPKLRNPEEPTALENILRPWQTEFLASFGIYRGDQLVKAYHRSGPALAKAMRRYRKKHGMTSFQSKSCAMALGIWSKTSKSFVRSIRKQLTSGVIADGIKMPNTLYILSSFIDQLPMDGSNIPRVQGFESIRSSNPSEECSL